MSDTTTTTTTKEQQAITIAKSAASAAVTPGATREVIDQLEKLLLSPFHSGTPSPLKQYCAGDDRVRQGKASHVSILTQLSDGEKIALKRQLIRDSDTTNDASIREWRIFQRLSRLAFQGKCFNFVLMLNWFREKRDDMPSSIVSQRQHFMNFVLEYCDGTLSDLQEVEISMFREILFQILWALYIAQKEAQFVHWDLHPRNILIQKPRAGQDACCRYTCERATTWFTTQVIVKLTDFGLSRVTLEDGTVVCNPKQSLASTFTPGTDIESLRNVLRPLKILWGHTGQNTRTLVRSVKTSLRKVAEGRESLLGLLHHEFFDKLQSTPSSFDWASTIVASANGSVVKSPDEDIEVRDLMEQLSVNDGN